MIMTIKRNVSMLSLMKTIRRTAGIKRKKFYHLELKKHHQGSWNKWNQYHSPWMSTISTPYKGTGQRCAWWSNYFWPPSSLMQWNTHAQEQICWPVTWTGIETVFSYGNSIKHHHVRSPSSFSVVTAFASLSLDVTLLETIHVGKRSSFWIFGQTNTVLPIHVLQSLGENSTQCWIILHWTPDHFASFVTLQGSYHGKTQKKNSTCANKVLQMQHLSAFKSTQRIFWSNCCDNSTKHAFQAVADSARDSAENSKTWCMHWNTGKSAVYL